MRSTSLCNTQEPNLIHLVHLRRLLDQVLCLFDNLSVITMQAGLKQAFELHTHVVRFWTTLGEQFMTFGSSGSKISMNEDDLELQTF